MQAVRLARALARIDDTLELDAVAALLIPLLTSGQNHELAGHRLRFSGFLWAGSAACKRLAEDEEIRRVLERFGIAGQFTDENLTFLLGHFERFNGAADIFGQPAVYTRFMTFAQTVASVHQLRVAMDAFVVQERRAGLAETEEALELRIFELGDAGLQPARLLAILDAIEDLHDAVADFLQASSARFAVAYLDSGSDWMVAVKSGKAVIDAMRAVISGWNRLRGLGLDQLQVESSFISGQLELLAKIDAAVEEGTLSQERGAHIRERILRRLDALTVFGVGLEGQDAPVMEEERRLLQSRRSVGLLSDGSAQTEQPPKAASDPNAE